MNCPKCKSYDVRPSRRKGIIEYVLSAAGVWPFRCQRCYKRYMKVTLGRPVYHKTHGGEADPGIALDPTDEIASR